MPIIEPSGAQKPAEPGKRILDLVEDPNVLVAEVQGRLVDLTYRLEDDEPVRLLTFEDPQGRETFWHTASHILAQAVKELFPHAKLTIGPPIEQGFYYDFYLGDASFSPEDLEKIEAKAKEIIQQDLEIVREELPKEEAIRLFQELDEPFKVELLQEMDEEVVTVYRQGSFVDLCRGPHLPRTGYVRAFKVLSSSAAYWRGDERGPVLQRIYGIAFPSQEALEEYLHRLEEAKRRDHRVLGKQLDLFSFTPEVGPGLVLWHPRGALIRRLIEDFLFQEHLKRGYQPVYTPHVGRAVLWQTSGHLDFYRENMYPSMELENEEYFVKPMNCPFHIQIYKSKLRSYRELPIRYMEFGTVYRFERSGVLHGLTRVRGFTQDDAHIFATPEQVEEEIIGVIDLALFVLKRFGLENFEVFISTRPEKYVGTPEMWDLATRALIQAAEKSGLSYEIEEGEGAFYGPKIDLTIRDALGRPWQCTTIQFDFNLPEKFDLVFRDSDGRDRRPIMIHRALIGAFERFFGLLIEHYAGNFPLWLAPEQVVVIPISEKFMAYAEEVTQRLQAAGFRALLDRRSEKMGYKIREHEMQKVPYMVIVGKREEESRTVAVRKHGVGDMGTMTVDAFLAHLHQELQSS